MTEKHNEAHEQAREEKTKGAPAEQPKGEKKSSVRSFLTLLAVAVVIAVAVSAVAAFWKDIYGFFYLRAWSPAGPREAAKAFCEAVVNKDAEAMRELLADSNMMKTDDAGKLEAIKPMTLKRARWFAVDKLQLSPEAAEKARVRYVTGQKGPVAIVAVPMEGGPAFVLLLALQPQGGKWKVVELRVPGPAVGGRSGSSGSGWQRAVEGKPASKEASAESEKSDETSKEKK